MDWGLPKDLCAYRGGCRNRRLARLCPGHKNLVKVTEQKTACALTLTQVSLRSLCHMTWLFVLTHCAGGPESHL